MRMSSIPTPPSTTLSTPSPTERPAFLPQTESQAQTPNCAMPPLRPLYLIVATSLPPPLGIGFKGQLPWPPIKSDMSFFRRVTTRLPPSYTPGNGLPDKRVRNAVIMGRKTWESIPPKFRPLKDRINVVITRSKSSVPHLLGGSQRQKSHGEVETSPGIDEHSVLLCPSLQEALQNLQSLHDEGRLGKMFIIGGAEIYRSAIFDLPREVDKEGLLLRIIQTQIRRKDGQPFDCDTHFPLSLGKAGTRSPSPASSNDWDRVDAQELEGWVGEDLPQAQGSGTRRLVKEEVDDFGDWLEEGDMQIRVLGWREKTR